MQSSYLSPFIASYSIYSSTFLLSTIYTLNTAQLLLKKEEAMASSLTMATLASSMTISTSNPKRLHVPIKASSATAGSVSGTTKQESSVEVSGRNSNGKRAVMLAAAAAAITAVVVPGGKGGAFAEEKEEDPKRGSPDSKKKYAPICVTMPTANACHY